MTSPWTLTADTLCWTCQRPLKGDPCGWCAVHDTTLPGKPRCLTERCRWCREPSKSGDGDNTGIVVVYADPCWDYSFNTTRRLRAIENQYPTLTEADIAALPVAALAGPFAVLYLWTTAPRLDAGMRVLTAWGFDFVTCHAWDKRDDERQETLWETEPGHQGMGHWAYVDHELLLIGKRGPVSPPPVSARRSSVFRAPRGKHSRKPALVREHIERCHPKAARRIELFARPPLAPGWECFGNEVDGRDIRIALAEEVTP